MLPKLFKFLPMIAISVVIINTAVASDELSLANNNDFQFQKIEAGCFMMGSDQVSLIEKGKRPYPPMPDEFPRHQVCVDTFWLGTYEVTQAQWHQIMKTGIQSEQPNHPAAKKSWKEVQAFIAKLNASSTGKYRLPTEAEWEYACQAGNPEPILGDATRHDINNLMTRAWFIEPERWNHEAQAVGQLVPNKWGLYDMLGNVWEWTQDSYVEDGYKSHASSNPKIINQSSHHVIRGGSFSSRYHLVRCGARNYGVEDDRLPSIGLRLVKELAH